jgi:hypothetical protein
MESEVFLKELNLRHVAYTLRKMLIKSDRFLIGTVHYGLEVLVPMTTKNFIF